MIRRVYYNPVGEVDSTYVFTDDLFKHLYEESLVGRIDERSVESVSVKYTNGETFVYIPTKE